MGRGVPFSPWLRRWWNAPTLLDQFLNIFREQTESDVLELTEVYGSDPFGRFVRNKNEASG